MTDLPFRPVRLLWITPELQGGIASYSQQLWPAVAAAAHADGGFEPLELLQTAPQPKWNAISAARELQPDLVHVQHEYGLFGGTNPFLDVLPLWLRRLKQALPQGTPIVATAHNVVPEDHRFATRGRGWRRPLYSVANATLLPWLQYHWREGTWGRFQGVIVHSSLQEASLQRGGLPLVSVIPHVVPAIRPSADDRPENPIPRIGLFGYFGPEKGQDVAIEAMRHVRTPALLRLAGGVGHPMNNAYYERCRQRIAECGLRDRIEVTGFVPEEDVSRVFQETDLVMAPFRSTSGSGSLVQALARGAAVLASDLPLNREINDRVPGTLAFFASEDPLDCAQQIETLLADADRRRRLGQQARQYAATHSPASIARQHLDFYRRILAQESSAGRRDGAS
jgi:glycosyltransferase involved in cell wall biosynthesis